MRLFPIRPALVAVVLVSGGVLAALPFRRTDRVASPPTPRHATGPTGSDLFLVPTTPTEQAARIRLPPSTIATDARPKIAEIPLSFDDLTLPIDVPQPIASRFDATRPPRRDHQPTNVEADKVVASRSRAASFGAEKDENLEDRVTSRVVASRRDAPSSVMAQPANDGFVIEKLPAPNDRRTRHWIVQP